jgi:hypothetical protein
MMIPPIFNQLAEFNYVVQQFNRAYNDFLNQDEGSPYRLNSLEFCESVAKQLELEAVLLQNAVRARINEVKNEHG